MPERPRGFALHLGLVTVGALVLRLVYAVGVKGNEEPGGDGFYFHHQAVAISQGDGFINPIAWLGDQMTKFTTELGFKGFQNPDEVGAAATDYLRVLGHLAFGYFWARMAQVAMKQVEAGNPDPFYKAKLQTARFYFARLFPETATLMRTARSGAAVLLNTDEALA